VIVECPRCSARYRVEEEVLKDEPTFKCSRCSHIFSYEGGRSEPEPEPEPEPPRRPAAGTSSESLSFAFADPSSPEPTRGVHTPPLPPPPPPDFSRRGRGEEEEEEEFVFDDDAAEEEPLTSEAEAEEEDDDDEPRFVRGEDELRVEEEAQPRPLRPWIVFLGLLALLYANVALYMRNHPDEAIAALTRIPFAGRILTEDRLLQTRVLLEDVRGTYQRIKDDRVVFIVSGRAVNTAPQALRGIQIESSLFGADGGTLDSKSIYCGNAMSLKIVKDLSSKEISLLQRLEPPARFEVQPGESATFTVVFMNPPEGMSEFDARVVAAQRALS
jgi:predicted Zn finger-like uncharacterized protein